MQIEFLQGAKWWVIIVTLNSNEGWCYKLLHNTVESVQSLSLTNENKSSSWEPQPPCPTAKSWEVVFNHSPKDWCVFPQKIKAVSIFHSNFNAGTHRKSIVKDKKPHNEAKNNDIQKKSIMEIFVEKHHLKKINAKFTHLFWAEKEITTESMTSII